MRRKWPLAFTKVTEGCSDFENSHFSDSQKHFDGSNRHTCIQAGLYSKTFKKYNAVHINLNDCYLLYYFLPTGLMQFNAHRLP